jgi:LDH2 family malate/lactate/ureidoglycolate dehydrogenase
MLAPYVERMANEGLIGVMLTTSEALVAPWGGARAMVGTNPIGIGVPTLEDPLVVDMSTAAVSAGKILDYAARSEQIPLGWAVDEKGRQTTDSTLASRGAIAPFGGPKGYALGLGLEALVGMLSGTAFGREVHGTLDTEKPPTKGDVLVAVPVPENPVIVEALTSYLQQLRREGSEGRSVLIPGDRARTLREDRVQYGIPLDKRLWHQINDLAAAK